MSVLIGLLTEREQIAGAVAEAVEGVSGRIVRLSVAGLGAPPGALRVLDWASAGGSPPGSGVRSGLGAVHWNVVVCCSGETQAAAELAAQLGARQLVTLPEGAPWLADQVTPRFSAPVLAVTGAVGGIGATTVAIACAMAVPDCLLVDGDPLSVGFDVPLGLADGVGARLGNIPDRPLDAPSLRAALPRVGDIHVASGAADLSPDLLKATVGRLAAAARADFAAGVIDAGRTAGSCLSEGSVDIELTVSPATMAGAAGVARALSRASRARRLVLLRETPWMSADDLVAELRRRDVAEPQILALPYVRRLAERSDCSDLRAGRVGRALERLGERIWQACS